MSTVDARLMTFLNNCLCLRSEHSKSFLQPSQRDAEEDEASEKELDILFSSLHNIYKMGCEVTSVYNDEITGKVGYNKRIVEDLLKRDYRRAYGLESEMVRKEVMRVEGFTQSFAIGRICFAVIAGVECVVYNAGRFIVMEGVRTETRKHLPHRDLVTAFSVSGKLALAGTYGGELTLWDLEFAQARLQLMLPEGSLNVTTVGLTSKYLFATDNSQPNSLAFCYDLRTGKLKCYAVVPTLEAALRSIIIKENMHVTACGDGIWFMETVRNGEELRVTRGMFGQFPKTSILCLQQAGNYVIGGGVDGYIYAWHIESFQCVKALKVHDAEVTSLAVRGKFIVTGCINGRIKVYSFKVSKVEKKGNEPRLQEEQGKEKDQSEIITFILVDTFQKEGSIQAIAISEQDPQLIYCQTRQGLLFQKRLPADQRVAKSVKSITVEDIARFCGDSHITLHEKRMYSAQKMANRLIFLDVHQVGKGCLCLKEERVAKLLEDCGEIIIYSPVYDELAYISNSKVMVCQTFGRVGDALSNANQSNFGQNTREIISLGNDKPIALGFTHFHADTFLVVTTQKNVLVLQREGRLTYEEKERFPYEKQVPSTLQVGDIRIVYQKSCKKWRDQRQEWRGIQEGELKHMEQLHCGPVISDDTRWKDLNVSVGLGFAIFYK